MKTLLSSRARPLGRRWSPVLLALLLVLLSGLILLPRQARSDPFIDPAFQAVWTRDDGPVAGKQVARTWMWGPVPGTAKREPYAEGQGGVRLVQYFDKGRMEINNPAGDPNSPFYVTSGLLSVELISGQVQVGNSRFEAHASAQIPLASDRDDPTAPTYASFLSVSNVPGAPHPASDATGGPVNTSIDRAGTVAPLGAGRQDYGVKYAYFEPKTGHNVPDVFWNFLNSTGPVQGSSGIEQGPLFQPWYILTGLPISEAYWARVKIAGQPTDVLIQAFERRILTFVPSNPAAWQVEMGNIGLHYLEWRYTVSVAPTAVPAPAGPPPVPPIVVTAINTGKSGLDLNEQTVTLENGGQDPVNMSAWRLVSPKNDHEDVYIFPQGVVLNGGAQLVIHAGQGYDGSNTLYMRRVTWLFDATGFDGVTLYDTLGRVVSSYYLQSGAPPTPGPGLPPAPTAVPTEPAPPGEDTPTPPAKETVTPEPTATEKLPTPEPTTATGIATPTPSSTPAGTATPTVTGTPATATPTASPTVTVTPTP
jgi:hypothetical protein